MFSQYSKAHALRKVFSLKPSIVCVFLCLTALANFNVSAENFGGEELKDPTRPASGSFLNDTDGEPGYLAGLLGGANQLLGSNYKVTFIRAGGTEPVAMVNETLVKAGDMIGEAEVISIDAQSVSLRVDGAIQRVATFNDTMKTLAEPQ